MTKHSGHNSTGMSHSTGKHSAAHRMMTLKLGIGNKPLPLSLGQTLSDAYDLTSENAIPKTADGTEIHSVGGDLFYAIAHKYDFLRPVASAQDKLDSANKTLATRWYEDALQAGPHSRKERESKEYAIYGGFVNGASQSLSAASDVAGAMGIGAEMISAAALVFAPVTDGASALVSANAAEIAEDFNAVSSGASAVSHIAQRMYLDFLAVQSQDGAGNRDSVIAQYGNNNLDLVNDAISLAPAVVSVMKATKAAKNPKKFFKNIKIARPLIERLKSWAKKGRKIAQGLTRHTSMFGYWLKFIDELVDLTVKIFTVCDEINGAANFAAHIASKAGHFALDAGKAGWNKGKAAYHLAKNKTAQGLHWLHDRAETGLHRGMDWMRHEAQAVKSGAVHAWQWGRNKAQAASAWGAEKAHEAGSLAYHLAVNNREWIGATLKESSEVFGLVSATTGIAAGVLALTGVGAPAAAFLGTASAVFGAGAIAARSWYSTSLAVGTLDGSVTQGRVNQEVKGVAVDMALFGAKRYADTLIKANLPAAQQYAGADYVGPKAVGIVNRLNNISALLRRVTGLKLAPILQDPALASRFKALKSAYDLTKTLDKTIKFFTNPITGRGMHWLGEKAHQKADWMRHEAQAAKSGAVHAWQWGKNKVHAAGAWSAEKARQTGAWVGEKAHQAWSGAKGMASSAWAWAGNKINQGRNILGEKLSGAKDGDLTGPFYPDSWKGPRLDPHTATQAQIRAAIPGGAGVFVNGIRVQMDGHIQSAQQLANATHRPIVGVYNATGGAVKDLLQSASDKMFDLVPNKATKTMVGLIQSYGDKNKPNGGLPIYAHSQGSIIVSEALRQAKHKGVNIGANEITTFGNAAFTMPEGAKAYHNYVFDSDAVATSVGSTSLLTRLLNALPLARMGVRSTAQDTTVLHNKGGLIRPHGMTADPVMENGREKRDAQGHLITDALPGYISSLAAFQAKEKTFAVPAAPPKGIFGRAAQGLKEQFQSDARVSRSLGATGFAMARGIGSGIASGVGGAYNSVAAQAAHGYRQSVAQPVTSGYGKMDAGIRGLPSLPFVKPNTVWGGVDSALRATGRGADAGLRGAGRGMDWLMRHLGGGVVSGGDALGRRVDKNYDQWNKVQRKGDGAHPDVDPTRLRTDLIRQGGSGAAPDTNLRQKLGGHLGFDPAGARLHRGPAAAQAARHLNAEAFTIGRDVFFGEGRFDAASGKGLGLIAHELTHVGQQTGTTGDKTRFYTASGGDEMEQEARQTEQRVLARAGNQSGLFVENYVRSYSGEDGATLSHADQQRLDTISLQAIQYAEQRLATVGHQNTVCENVSIEMELDLSGASDAELSAKWGEAICASVLKRLTMGAVAPEQIARREIPNHSEVVWGEAMDVASPVKRPQDWSEWDRQGVQQLPQAERLSQFKTFTDSARYNTEHDLPNEYETIDQRNAYYAVMNLLTQQQQGTKGVLFFEAARRVTGINAVGAVDHDIGWALHSDEAIKVLHEVNAILLAANMRIINRLLNQQHKPTDPRNLASDAAIDTLQFDLDMVEMEQGKVQGYLDERKGKISDKARKDINDDLNFKGIFRTLAQHTIAESQSFEWAKQALGVSDLDFMQHPHRVAIGKALVHILHGKTLEQFKAYWSSGRSSGSAEGTLNRSALPGYAADGGGHEVAALAMERHVTHNFSPAFALPGGGSMPHSTAALAMSTPYGGMIQRKDDGKGEDGKGEDGWLATAGKFAKWLWGVAEGGFNEDPSAAQIGTDMVIGLIPVVGQATAARDLSADVYYIGFTPQISSPMRWLSAALDLIGAVPEVGDVVKDLGKLALKGGAKAIAEQAGNLTKLARKYLPKNIGEDLGLLPSFVRSHWGAMTETALHVWNATLAKIKGAISYIPSFVGSARSKLENRMGAVYTASKEFMGKAFTQARRIVDEAMEKFEQMLSKDASKEGEPLSKAETKAVPHEPGEPVPPPGEKKPPPTEGKSGKQEHPRQNSRNLETLYKEAEEAQKHLAQATREIAAQVGGKAEIAPLKSQNRALEKIASEYKGDASRITDLARSSVVCKTPKQVEEALAAVKSRFKTVRVKDRFKAPQGGYRDILLNLEMPNGHIVEMQIQLEAISAVKQGIGHRLYEEIQQIQRAAEKANRPFTELERTRLEALQKQMKQAYDTAFQQAGK